MSDRDGGHSHRRRGRYGQGAPTFRDDCWKAAERCTYGDPMEALSYENTSTEAWLMVMMEAIGQ